MIEPIVKLVYDNLSGQLDLPKEVLPDNGVPFGHHFNSTSDDNLVELAGRTCYDSSKSEKTRNSKDYHQHINDVNHGSTQEHINLVHEFPQLDNNMLLNLYRSFANKPGFYIRELPSESEGFYKVRVTGNLRAIKEWYDIEVKTNTSYMFDWIGYSLQSWALLFAPMVVGAVKSKELYKYAGNPSKPETEEEIWCSFYFGNVSRGYSHEQVRHKFRTAVSQRSTRYVDESESDWAWHPLILQYRNEINKELEAKESFLLETIPGDANNLYDMESWCKFYYKHIVITVEQLLISKGIDKFSARKQARGAARGILGNALSTEMIFSASLAQWKRMLLQRASEFADAEIRLVYNEVFNILREKFPSAFSGWTTSPCKDGFGFQVKVS